MGLLCLEPKNTEKIKKNILENVIKVSFNSVQLSSVLGNSLKLTFSFSL